MSALVGAVLASIPSPPWNSIEIGPLNLRFYGLMIALGVIAAVWLLGKQLETHGLGTTDDAGSIAVWSVAAGVIGARLYHVATDWSRFTDDLGSIPKIWEGGLGIPGGLIAGISVGVIQARRRGIRPGVVMTFAAPAIALAQAIGRWGNWFNQELFGRQTDLPWAIEIDDQHLPPSYVSGTTFHPTFLYESLWNIVLCIVLLRIQRQFRLAPGRLLAVYAIGYGIGRFWIEGLRIDPATDVAGLRINQWVSVAAVVVGVIALALTRGRTWDVERAGAGVGRARADGSVPTDRADDDDVPFNQAAFAAMAGSSVLGRDDAIDVDRDHADEADTGASSLDADVPGADAPGADAFDASDGSAD